MAIGEVTPLARVYMERLFNGLVDTFDFPRNIGWPPNGKRFYMSSQDSPKNTEDCQETVLQFSLWLPKEYEFLPYTYSMGITEHGFTQSIIGRKKP